MPISAIHTNVGGKKNRHNFVTPGILGGNDFVDSQERHNKRVVRAKTQSLPPIVALGASGSTLGGVRNIRTNPPSIPFIDRLHKTSKYYIIVSNDHNAGEDFISNPGYRSLSATASSISDAMNTATLYNITKVSAGERVVVIVLGGVYAEDVTLTNSIDLIGIGRPLINGKLTIPADVDDILIEGFEVNGGAALAIETKADVALSASVKQFVKDCWLHGTRTVLDISSPVWFEQCTIYSDTYDNGSADWGYHLIKVNNVNNWVANTFKNLGHGGSFASCIFLLCTIRAAQDFSSQERECAIWASNPSRVGNLSAVLEVDHCTVYGWIRNEVCMTWFRYSTLVGGYLFAGLTWLFFCQCDTAAANPSAFTFIDYCQLQTDYIMEEADMQAASIAENNYVYIRHCQHLKRTYASGGGAAISAIEINIVNLFGNVPPIIGAKKIVLSSISSQDFWYAPAGGGVELFVNAAIEMNSMPNAAYGGGAIPPTFPATVEVPNIN